MIDKDNDYLAKILLWFYKNKLWRKKDVFSTGKNIMLSKYDIMYINRNSTKVACTGTCQG